MLFELAYGVGDIAAVELATATPAPIRPLSGGSASAPARSVYDKDIDYQTHKRLTNEQSAEMTVEEFNAALIDALFVEPSSGGHLTSDNLITAIQQALDTASKTVSVAEFREQVVKNLSERLGGAGYVLTGTLAAAIQMALVPPSGGGLKYPLMMYKGLHDAELTRVVENRKEELAAVAEGWSRTPAKRPPSKNPLPMVEIDPARGADYRRVLLHSAVEEATFLRVTNPEDWVTDSVYALGGRPVGLDELVAEHAAALHKQLDQELRQPPEAESASFASSDTVGHEPNANATGEGKE